MGPDRKERVEPIAIIGMAGRFPDAENLRAFWSNLEKGHESLAEISDEELVASGLSPAFLNAPGLVKKATVLENADQFDAKFFGFNPREAEILDPQQRVFLECAWEAMEDAGYGGDSRPESVGVYAGASLNTYLLSNVLANPTVFQAVGGYQVMIANDKDFLSTRVSYKLNLKGPSLTIQTACSTSLVAVQIACQALLARQCELALAGGVSIGFPQKSGHWYFEGMIFSPDAHCRPFDEDGRGIRAGHGAGIVVLKRLKDAVRDGDSIRAVILGAAINNDGAAKMGYTAPSVDGQSDAISEAMRMGGVDPATIGYVEAHGTATPVGDPIEIVALQQSFRKFTDKKQFCAISALKSNIGHLDAAAGVAGLIKTVLSLQNKRIPPTLHFRRANSKIDFANSPFYVADKLVDWNFNGSPRRAAVSSFGIGGTNSHVVLEEAPPSDASQVRWPAQLLLLSARTPAALDAMSNRMAEYLRVQPEVPFADVCYTSQIGRTRFAHRRMLVCARREEAIEALGGVGMRKPVTAFEESANPSVVFMFSGQGSQYLNMGHGLYEIQPVFRQHIDFCAEFLKKELGCDLHDVIFSASPSELVNETRFTQPALFAVEYALAQMWMSWGLQPGAMIGHSIGEFVAACLSGVFSVEDALRVVAARGRIMQQMPAGSMLAVPMSVEQLQPLIKSPISIAAVNSPSLCTVSGPTDAVSSLQKDFASRGVECRPIHTSHAFHSEMMDGALDSFRATLRTVKLSAPNQPFISNSTGTWILPQEATDPEYWVKHLRGTVHFAKGIQELANSQPRVFLEVGPGQVLSTFARDCTRGMAGSQVLGTLPHPKDSQPDTIFLGNTVGKLWLAGARIQWGNFHTGETLHRVSIPTYFFERQRYWVPPQNAPAIAPTTTPEPQDPFARKAFEEWFYVPSWTRSLPSSVMASEKSHGPWLIFANDAETTNHLKEISAAHTDTFVLIQKGPAFQRRSDREYTIHPDRAGDYQRLLGELRASGITSSSVLYFWSLPDGAQPAAKNTHTVFHQLILLAQAFAESSLRGPMDWVIVTAGLHSVNGRETLDPAQALVLGPAKVIPREFPNIVCRTVDFASYPVPNAEWHAALESLLLEPAMPRPWRPIAYRDGHRWEQTFESVTLPVKSASPFRDRGIYLITGGTGGIGLTLAAYLAEQVHARLALLSRTKLPERSEWPHWIKTHGEADAVSRKIRELEKLEALGGEVLVLAADVSDSAAMQSALREVQTRFGPINGVIHAAGVAGGGLIQLKTTEAADRILSPKIEGTMLVHSLVKDQPLDFFILCSSIDAVTPIAGSADYAAANAFLDAFAVQQNQAGGSSAKPGTLFTSINWDAWNEVGMAANTEVPREMAEQRRAFLQSAIQPAEGIAAFRRVLGAKIPQAAVITRDFPRLILEIGRHKAIMETPASADPKAPQAAEEFRHPRPDLTNPCVLPESEAQHKMAAIWRELLGIAEIGIDDNFFELGGHSLLATGVLSRVRNVFGVSLPLRAIFEAPNIRQLTNHVETLQWTASGQTAPAEESGEREEVEL